MFGKSKRFREWMECFERLGAFERDIPKAIYPKLIESILVFGSYSSLYTLLSSSPKLMSYRRAKSSPRSLRRNIQVIHHASQIRAMYSLISFFFRYVLPQGVSFVVIFVESVPNPKHYKPIPLFI